MILFDQHTHSLNSHERACKSNVAEMCAGAAENGMSGIAITDHYDIGRRPVEEVTGFIRSSAEEVLSVREMLKEGFSLSLGMELGEGHMNTEESGAALQLAPFDIIIGSLHNIKNHRDFSAIGRDFEDKAALFASYLEEQLVMADWGRYDVLGHVTYPYRYFMQGENAPDIHGYEEQFRELFTKLAKKGLGIEINVSGLYRPEHGVTMPDLWELKLFRECGGEIVTMGSDSHDAEHAGMGIKRGAELLKAAGFEYFAVFKNRKPHFLPL